MLTCRAMCKGWSWKAMFRAYHTVSTLTDRSRYSRNSPQKPRFQHTIHPTLAGWSLRLYSWSSLRKPRFPHTMQQTLTDWSLYLRSGPQVPAGCSAVDGVVESGKLHAHPCPASCRGRLPDGVPAEFIGWCCGCHGPRRLHRPIVSCDSSSSR